MLELLFNIILLSLIVLLLSLVSVVSLKGFGKCFKSICFYLLIMVFINLVCIFSHSILVSLIFLIMLSLYSMFLICYGYGTGHVSLSVILFNTLADVLIILVFSYVSFFEIDNNLNSFSFYGFGLDMFLVFIFLIYSLFGFFGFWLFWAMEASYFISSFMHSCGLISLGLVFIIKMSILGVIWELNVFLGLVKFISLSGFFIFLFLFFIVKDCNKSFGFYSISSICFLMFLCVSCNFIALNYFFLSSLVKVLIFDLLSFLNKSKNVKWLISLLIVFNVFLHSSFFLLSFYLESLSHYKELISFIFLVKTISVSLFIFKVFGVLSIKFNLNYNKSNTLVILFFILLVLNKFLGLVYFGSLIVSSFLSYSLLIFIVFSFLFFFNKSFNFYWQYVQSIVGYLVLYLESIPFSSIFNFKIPVFKLLISIWSNSIVLDKEFILFCCLLFPLLILIFL